MHITIRGIPELADTPDTSLGTLEVLSCTCPSDPNTWPTFPDFSDGELIGMMGSLRTDFGMMGSPRTDFVILKWLLLARNNRGTFEITFCVPFLASDETPLSFKYIKPLPRSMALHLMDAVPHSLCREPFAEQPAQWHVEAVFFADCPDQACLCFTTLDYKDMPGLGLYWREIAGPSVPETSVRVDLAAVHAEMKELCKALPQAGAIIQTATEVATPSSRRTWFQNCWRYFTDETPAKETEQARWLIVARKVRRILEEMKHRNDPAATCDYLTLRMVYGSKKRDGKKRDGWIHRLAEPDFDESLAKTLRRRVEEKRASADRTKSARR